ncbi:transaldolase family protein [Candidatus Nesciobacter abundans]|uniref:Transaldolase n=1 Tax=Candidatus Nesciobacter abundans TaxID=2601668 RepID=A0A5C0UH60_9PROT|nr:transaldolase family protein [Candidatus Nesciobacter abundans]QEK39011.1 hypothetical protein FZC36_00995 [Candidatus Nesciobacter abundans]
MKLFLDSAEIEEAKLFSKFGVIKGVTTNPKLMSDSFGKIGKQTTNQSNYDISGTSKDAKSSVEERYSEEINHAIEISKITGTKVSVQPSSYDYESIVGFGKLVFKNRNNLILKVPPTFESFEAVRYIRKNLGFIDVNLTLCFSVNQAILGMQLGVQYISIFVGRLEDQNENPFEIIETVKCLIESQQLEEYGYMNSYISENKEQECSLDKSIALEHKNTEIIAASIRSSRHVRESFKSGADIVTTPGKIIRELFNHNLTDKAIKSI